MSFVGGYASFDFRWSYAGPKKYSLYVGLRHPVWILRVSFKVTDRVWIGSTLDTHICSLAGKK